MHKVNHHATPEDAKAALAIIEQANSITASSMRPPLWLVLLCSGALGLKTTAMALMNNNVLWQSIQWGTYITLCLSLAFWIIRLRIKGITIKIVEVNVAKTGIISALVICTVLVMSRIIYLQTSTILFVYLAGLLNASVLALSMHSLIGFSVKAKE